VTEAASNPRITSQKSIRYLPERSQSLLGRRYYEILYPSMLIQDVAQSLIVARGYAGMTDMHVRITPPDPVAEKAIARAVGESSYEHDLASALWHFSQQCAVSMMEYGHAVYEVVYHPNGPEAGTPEWRLVQVQQPVIWRRRQTLQLVPCKVAEELAVPERIAIPQDRVLRFAPPRKLGRSIKRAMESLAILSENPSSRFLFQEADVAQLSCPYNLQLNMRTRKLAVAHATESIGWNARWLFDDETLEPYRIHRMLQFERFKMELRNTILGTLNDGIARIGLKLGFSGRIEIEGWPSIKDIETAQAHLTSGEKGLEEIMKPILGY